MSRDRGATMFEMLIVLMLTALTASALVTVVTVSANSVGRSSESDPRVQIAADSLTRDLRIASEVIVVTHDALAVTALDVVTPDGTIRWSSDGQPEIIRTAADGSQATILDGLSATHPVTFHLLTRRAQPVAPSDAAAVRACTSRVAIDVTGTDGRLLHRWSVSLRVFGDEKASC